jgi:uncharacterized protein YjbI with pentapeptide repeats
MHTTEDDLPELEAGCEVENICYRGLDINGISLAESKIIDCEFIDCSLNSLDLRDAVIQAAFLSSKIQGINFFVAKRALLSLTFKNCLVRYSSFAELVLPGITLEHCTLEQIDFADAKLIGAKFNNCTFADCTFKNTDLSKADFRSARGYDIDPTLNKIAKARFDLPEAVSLLSRFNIRLD